jgi:hypothetical protein
MTKLPWNTKLHISGYQSSFSSLKTIGKQQKNNSVIHNQPQKFPSSYKPIIHPITKTQQISLVCKSFKRKNKEKNCNCFWENASTEKYNGIYYNLAALDMRVKNILFGNNHHVRVFFFVGQNFKCVRGD